MSTHQVIKQVLSLLAMLALTACANKSTTANHDPSSLDVVSEEASSAFTQPQDEENLAQIIVYRLDTGSAWSTASIYIDEKKQFQLSKKHYGYAYLTPGVHSLRVSWSYNPGVGWDGKGNFEAGKRYYYRLRGSGFTTPLILSSEHDSIVLMRYWCHITDQLHELDIISSNKNAPFENTTTDSDTIDRSEGFSKIAFGMRESEVLQLVGKPDSTSERAHGRYSTYSTAKWVYRNIGYVEFLMDMYSNEIFYATKVVRTP